MARTHPGAVIQGMLVQKMVPKGRETILGMTRDPHFGPLLMFGLGGTFVEVFQDVMLPVGAHLRGLGPENDPGTQGVPHPEELPGRTPGGPGGHRGIPGAPLPDGAGFSELKELDINPFMVFDEGQGAAVVDARIFLS